MLPFCSVHEVYRFACASLVRTTKHFVLVSSSMSFIERKEAKTNRMQTVDERSALAQNRDQLVL